jgi:enoyl-CoA hydratase/carnithine racemase
MASAWEAPWSWRWLAIFALPAKAPYSRFQKLSRARRPDGATSQRLVHYFGRGKAIELALTGSQITATEAHALGAVNHVVAGAEVLSKAQEIANGIARMRTKSIKCIMGAMHVPYRIGLAEG